MGYETAIIAIYHSRFYTDLYHGLEVKGHNFCPQSKKNKMRHVHCANDRLLQVRGNSKMD